MATEKNRVEAKPEVELRHSNATRDKEVFQSLLKSPGWIRLVAVLEEQLALRTKDVMLKPLGDGYTVEHQEYVKGEYNGILTVINLPHLIIEDAKFTIAHSPAPTATEEDQDGTE